MGKACKQGRKANGQYKKGHKCNGKRKRKGVHKKRRSNGGRVRLFRPRTKGGALTTRGLTKTQKKKLHSYCRRLKGVMISGNKGKRIYQGEPGWGTVSRYGSRAKQPEMSMPALIPLGVCF